MILFDKIPEYKKLKLNLKHSIEIGKISHAQIIDCPDGAPGFLTALAFCQMMVCDNENAPCGVCTSCKQVANHTYPDLNFSFPYISTNSKNEDCEDYMNDWRNFIDNNDFFTTAAWNKYLESGNKQPQIYTSEGQRIIRKLSLKSYSGKYKFLILWQPELLNNNTANKLLKFIEEPDPDTRIIMISHNLENVLNTILSRCQTVKMGVLPDQSIEKFLINKDVEQNEAHTISLLSEGNLGYALSLIEENSSAKDNALLFRDWLRVCYTARAQEIIQISERINSLNRDLQKRLFIDFQRIFNRAFTYSHSPEQSSSLIELSKISPFITHQNIHQIYTLIEEAIRDLSRNCNPKIMVFDLCLKIHQQLHQARG